MSEVRSERNFASVNSRPRTCSEGRMIASHMLPTFSYGTVWSDHVNNRYKPLARTVSLFEASSLTLI